MEESSHTANIDRYEKLRKRGSGIKRLFFNFIIRLIAVKKGGIMRQTAAGDEVFRRWHAEFRRQFGES